MREHLFGIRIMGTKYPFSNMYTENVLKINLLVQNIFRKNID